MGRNSLNVPCPKCDEKNLVPVGELETWREIEHLCIGCGTKFVVDLNEVRETTVKKAKEAFKDLKDIKIELKL